MKVGSLFAGIGGFDLGFERAGWTTAWQVEIDPKCQDVLARHWPEVERYGDVREVGAHNLAPVDVIAGGFPCSDVSVAGRRAGLAGERSGLWWEFHRVLDELRPEWCVIENVPGLLSSNGGRDMGAILGALGDLGYGWAYRVLDAQFVGLAQRRKRVFIVGHLGDRRAVQVLLEPEGGGRDTPPSREARKVTPTLPASGAGTGRTGNERTEADMLVVAATLASGSAVGANRPGRRQEDDVNLVAGTLGSNASGGQRYDLDSQTYVPDLSYALSAPHTTSRHDASVETFVKTGRAQSPTDGEGWEARGVTPTLNTFDVGEARATVLIQDRRVGVRRLTPVECERLMGLPDGWTERGATKAMSDSARYRMCGNAVAVPVVEWIARRITMRGQ